MPANSSVVVDPGKILEIFRGIDSSNMPGVAVGIAVRGVPVLRCGLGLASGEQPCLLTPSTRMRIASITKQFTCLAYLLLCERAVADFDAKIGDYIPEIHQNYRTVAVRHLMSHVSGIRDALELYYQFGSATEKARPEAVLELYKSLHGFNFRPGARWSYNNGGYVLLSLIIERLSGRPLAEFMRQAIFEPIGMSDTVLLPSDLEIVERRATPAMRRPDGRYQKYVVQGASGEGGILSTADDLLRWLSHMDSPKVGSSETWKMMRSKQVLANGVQAGYGLGLELGTYRGRQTIAHSGGLPSCNSYAVKLPSDGLDVVVLANRSDVASPRLAYEVIDACIPDLEERDWGGKAGIIEGTFVSPTGDRVLRLSHNDDRWTACVDGLDLDMLVCRDGTLRLPPENSTFSVSIRVPEPSDPGHIDLISYGEVERLERQRPVSTDGADILSGRYQCREAEISAVIARDDSGLTLLTSGVVGSKSARLRPISSFAWRAEAIDDFRSAFIVGQSGSGDELHFRSIQTRDLTFSRVE